MGGFAGKGFGASVTRKRRLLIGEGVPVSDGGKVDASSLWNNFDLTVI